MDYVQLFTTLLQNSADAFTWAARQMPTTQLYASSPRRPESWSVARNVLHLQHYEEFMALPNMHLWLYETAEQATLDAMPPSKSGTQLIEHEESLWAQQPELDVLLARFHANRVAQIALLPRFSSNAWEEERDAVWGLVTLRWLLTKTYQHTAEHTNSVLQSALFWAGLRSQDS